MSGFKPYPAYKDSGVEWLGEVPEHWDIGSFRRLIKSVRNGTTIDQIDEAENTIAVSRIETISTGEINFEKVGYVERAEAPDRFLLSDGDILFSHINSLPMVGNVAIYRGERPLLHGMNLLRIQPRSEFASDWIFYWLKSKNIRQEVESRAKPAINQASISTDSVRAIPALIPPNSEQTQIARFLDHETARIDALIEEQQRLIELLKEKRQAVISHAVIKGLDPTVPMKDSGVEWLGEVPAHWVVAALKWFWSVADCKHITAEFVDDGIPLASIREVQSRYVTLDNAKQTTEVFYQQLIEAGREPVAGDLIFSRNATVGEVAQVADWHTPFAMGQDVCLLKKQREWLSSDFLQAVLRSPVVTVQLDNLMIGSTFKRVNVEDIRGLIVPMPPQGEQKNIAEYLSRETEAFDSLLSEAETTIALLQERRSALISAAVTGKIDVRGWQPPARAQAPECEEVEAV